MPDRDPPLPEPEGGLGGPPAEGVRDTRLYARAIRERWPLPESARIKVLKRLCKVVDEDAVHDPLPPPGHREVVAASRALLAADKINLEAERLELLREKLRRDAEAQGRADQPGRTPPRIIIPGAPADGAS